MLCRVVSPFASCSLVTQRASHVTFDVIDIARDEGEDMRVQFNDNVRTEAVLAMQGDALRGRRGAARALDVAQARVRGERTIGS